MPRVAPEYSLEYKEEARRKIMDAGLRAFAEKGYHETTMDDVADTLGVSKGTLYLYFRNKEELFRAIWSRFADHLKEDVRRLFHEGTLPDFGNILDNALTGDKFMPVWVEMVAESTRDESLRRIMAENIENRIQLIEEFLEEQTKVGHISAKGDLRTKSIAVLTFLFGTLVLRALKFDEPELKLITRKSLGAILENISTG